MGVIAIGSGNLESVRKSAKAHADRTEAQLEKILMDRVYRWVYAESQPRSRIVVMSERQVIDWAKRLGVKIPY